MVNKKYSVLFVFILILSVVAISLSVVSAYPTCTSWHDHSACGKYSCTGAYKDLCSIGAGCCIRDVSPPSGGTWLSPTAWGCNSGATVSLSRCHTYESNPSKVCCYVYCNGNFVGPDLCGPPTAACTPSNSCAANTCIGKTCSNGCGGKVKGTKDCTPKSKVYWANMNGNKITNADFGDTVELVMTNKNSGNFSIKEKNLIIDDKIRNVAGMPRGQDAVGTWTISQEDLDKASNLDKFYFINSKGNESGYLDVSPIGNDDPMNITLVSPTCGSYFDGNTEFSINVQAKDADDLIEGTVSIDGNKIGTFTNGGVIINKTLSPGNYQIEINANNTRGKKSRIISNIMVLDKKNGKYVDGKYIAACITKPRDLSNFDGSVVSFDASSTRAIKITNGVMHLLVPDNGDTFSWYWKFMPENIQRNFVESTNPIAYRFTAEFPTPGDNSASLMVVIN